ncbi:ATP-binding cassette domain-containing protein [Liquorilactobacillus mali]|uniref:ABC transporter, ATP-binding protein n=1 Tax=Liquorilactobacillus mali KCTC 3596 = DSM 20444 TaxID=1046596 RepID=J1F385_9LACO|nr:ABC transporter ATP-binding protein [Liquorilactobacillus mali]EJE99732.1 ABC transporter, ATP-binding protein [Liquorilactobacillus mali KCTC 3596 = DSM 20444]KRN09126.1 ABC transporter, ATP-binding protein [Liquorilactobacillus mali KCTC 3596 = DSM 20444]MDC7953444.1 ABC transporter ATP-binding protein [Liquorilactobacillus mali]MDV7757818.1 ATP-binding cassette domain-containing protein [Liquorilactobacillus mali]QFQ73909.1 ABC transporter ATP-binding protein [Liquorilactobacillus mali]
MGIEVKNIQKSFNKKKILSDVNFELEPGKIYGLLGRNGAGKSTLLSIMANRIFSDSGNVLLDGKSVFDLDEALGQIYLMSERNLYPEGTKIEKIFKLTELFYGSFNYDYANELADKFGLDVKQKFGKLSTGYRSIFKLIIALTVPARYIFLDEPILGLDANHRELFYRELLDNYVKTQKTFIISTHLIEEITNILEHVFILCHGEIVIDGDVEDVLKKAYLIAGPQKDVDDYCRGLNIIGKENLGSIHGNYVYGNLDDNRILPDTVSVERMDLQKLFVNLTNMEETKK